MTTVKQLRTVHVTRLDAVAGSGGRAWLGAYGLRWVAAQAGCSLASARAAAARGEFADPLACARWILERRGPAGRRAVDAIGEALEVEPTGRPRRRAKL